MGYYSSYFYVISFFYFPKKLLSGITKQQISYYSDTLMASFIIVPKKPHWRIWWKSFCFLLFIWKQAINITLTFANLGFLRRIVKKYIFLIIDLLLYVLQIHYFFARTHRIVETEIHWSLIWLIFPVSYQDILASALNFQPN